MAVCYKLIGAAFVLMAPAGQTQAGDVFPAYTITSISIQVPVQTNNFMYASDPANETNGWAIYHLFGQIFSNAVDGKIQTIAGGFSGSTDRSTPYKTLTELLAAYQQGVDEHKLRLLYDAPGQKFLDSIYTNPQKLQRFKDLVAPIKSMNARLCYQVPNGMVVYVSMQKLDGSEVDPFFLVHTNGKFWVSSFTLDSPRDRNIFQKMINNQ